MKKLIALFTLFCGLRMLASDATIANAPGGGIATVPNGYRMPWENPGVQGYYITFSDLTNQVIAGMASQAYANGAAQAATNTLSASALASGTVPLARLSNITSNQLDAGTWQLATNASASGAPLNGTNVWTGTNTFTNIVQFSNNGTNTVSINAATGAFTNSGTASLGPSGKAIVDSSGITTIGWLIIGAGQKLQMGAGRSLFNSSANGVVDMWADGYGDMTQFDVHRANITNVKTLTTTAVILTNSSTPPTVSATTGAQWNSNSVLYWVTSTKTNLVSDGR